MRDAISLDTPRATPRPGRALRYAWHGVGRALARLNGSAVAGGLHASDMAQMRRAMRD